jgi:hypothetical protein
MPSPRTVFIGSVIVFILAAAAGYWYLGGFNEPQVSIVEHGGYRMVGKYYSGESGSSEANSTFREVAKLSQSGTLAGTMAVVILHEATEELDSVHQFVGILLPDKNQKLPPEADSLQLLEIPNRQSVRAQLQASSLVWPSPDKIVEAARQYAQEKGLQLAPNLTIEKYVSPTLLEVELPVAYQKPTRPLPNSTQFIVPDSVADLD